MVEEHAVHDDIAPLVFLQLVEGAEEGGLAGPGETDDHHGLALTDCRCDAPYGVVAAVPLVDVPADDDVLRPGAA